MSEFYVSHSILGRLHIVSKIEAASQEEALDLMRSGADDDPNTIVGEVFVMDRRDGQDEYEIVDPEVTKTPGFSFSPTYPRPSEDPDNPETWAAHDPVGLGLR